MNHIPHVSINGFPGVGKTTMLETLERLGYKIHVIPRYYSRPRRPGEETSREYRFLEPEMFAEFRKRGYFIPGTIREVVVNRKIYHTAIPRMSHWPKAPRETHFIVSFFGRSIFKIPNRTEWKLIFISCHSKEALLKRLTDRCLAHGIDPRRKLQRIEEYELIKIWDLYDFIVYNDDENMPEVCAREIAQIALRSSAQPLNP